ncbi:MAG: 4Fe-4S binding protein [Dehalococcoidales bacterium]|nr:4Fe-4S binding protein [Dehalococcoidales bacterium]
MNEADKIYRDLQQALDRLPGGFRATTSGIELRILKRLFTPEEAEIALELSMKPETLERIHRRIRRKKAISPGELRDRLEQMVRKGIILAHEEGFPERRYSAAAFSTGGIMNFQVNRLSPELMQDFRRYQEEVRAGQQPPAKRLPPLRTVPVMQSIPHAERQRISHYDDVRKIIENTPGKIAVTSCICRQGRELFGEKCTKTDLMEACLMIGADHARRHVEMGIGRYITKEEALGILERARKAGLVIQPESSQRPEAICLCCGDCCVFLKAAKSLPRPADMFLSNFYVQLDENLCNGCGLCVEHCQLEARFMENGVARIKPERCCGCGNCVVVCPTGANRLLKKEKEYVPVKDKHAYNMELLSGRLGRWGMLKLKARMLLGMKV